MENFGEQPWPRSISAVRPSSGRCAGRAAAQACTRGSGRTANLTGLLPGHLELDGREPATLRGGSAWPGPARQAQRRTALHAFFGPFGSAAAAPSSPTADRPEVVAETLCVP